MNEGRQNGTTFYAYDSAGNLTQHTGSHITRQACGGKPTPTRYKQTSRVQRNGKLGSQCSQQPFPTNGTVQLDVNHALVAPPAS